MKDFKIIFCLADSRYLTAVRLAVGGVCAAAELDIDAAEDFKVSVTESCLILKNCGFSEAEITLTANGGMGACICGLGGGQPCGGENEFSLALISALVSSCDIQRRGEVIEKISIKV